MVCVPCFAIPALLFIFRLVIQPLVYRIWGYYMQEPALSCPLPQKKDQSKKDAVTNDSEDTTGLKEMAAPVESAKDK